MVSAQATSEPAPEPRPGPTGMPLRLGPLDEVRDDQEVAGEAHLDDDAELALQPVEIGLARIAHAMPAGLQAAAPAPRAPGAPAPRPRCRAVGEAGRIGCALGGMKAQRRAISRVLSKASGRSANSSRISRADLNQCSGVTRRRSSWSTKAPSAMHSSASCAAYMPSSAEDRRRWWRPAAGRSRRPARSAPLRSGSPPAGRGAAARHRAGRGRCLSADRGKSRAASGWFSTRVPPDLARHAAGQRQQPFRVRRQVRQRDLRDEARLGVRGMHRWSAS